MDADEIRAKKLNELKSKIAKEEEEKKLARELLDEKAYERLMNIRAVKPDRFEGVLRYLMAMKNAGYVKGKIDERTLILILEKMSKRNEGKITFIRK